MAEGAARLKKDLTTSSLEMGSTEGERADRSKIMMSDAQRGYKRYTDHEIATARPQLAASVKADLRRHHFTFGDVGPTMESTEQEARRSVIMAGGEYRDPKEDKDRAFALKQALQTSSYEIGTDAKFM